MAPRLRIAVGSKWTSDVEVEGWRHFEVISLRAEGSARLVELAPSCDRRLRVTIAAELLANRRGWAPGWLRLG